MRSFPLVASLVGFLLLWSWFDTILGVDSQANPRGYCMTVGADP